MDAGDVFLDTRRMAAASAGVVTSGMLATRAGCLLLSTLMVLKRLVHDVAIPIPAPYRQRTTPPAGSGLHPIASAAVSIGFISTYPSLAPQGLSDALGCRCRMIWRHAYGCVVWAQRGHCSGSSVSDQFDNLFFR
jgi:hypothetical protein